MTYPCDECVKTRDHPIFRYPTHLVHPEHWKPMVFNVRGEAVCPDCGALWRRLSNEAELVQ